jgi:O-antigen/teichoic acid export membrane protein
MKIGIPTKSEELKYHLHDPLFKNAIHLIATTVATAALGFVFWMVVTRYYASEEVGLASTIISAMNLLAMLSLLGFNVALIRFLPNADEKKQYDQLMFHIESYRSFSYFYNIFIGT